MVIQDGAGQIQFYLDKKADPELRAKVEAFDIGDIVAGEFRLDRTSNQLTGTVANEFVEPVADLRFWL